MVLEQRLKHYVEDNFGIARKSLRDWESQKNELEKDKNKDAKFRIKGNISSITFEKEEELIAWINFNRKVVESIAASIIIIKICDLFVCLFRSSNQTGNWLIFNIN